MPNIEREPAANEAFTGGYHPSGSTSFTATRSAALPREARCTKRRKYTLCKVGHVGYPMNSERILSDLSEVGEFSLAWRKCLTNLAKIVLFAKCCDFLRQRPQCAPIALGVSLRKGLPGPWNRSRRFSGSRLPLLKTSSLRVHPAPPNYLSMINLD